MFVKVLYFKVLKDTALYLAKLDDKDLFYYNQLKNYR